MLGELRQGGGQQPWFFFLKPAGPDRPQNKPSLPKSSIVSSRAGGCEAAAGGGRKEEGAGRCREAKSARFGRLSPAACGILRLRLTPAAAAEVTHVFRSEDDALGAAE